MTRVYESLRIMTLLSRSSALCTAFCDEGNERPDTLCCSRSQSDTDCTSGTLPGQSTYPVD